MTSHAGTADESRVGRRPVESGRRARRTPGSIGRMAERHRTPIRLSRRAGEVTAEPQTNRESSASAGSGRSLRRSPACWRAASCEAPAGPMATSTMSCDFDRWQTPAPGVVVLNTGQLSDDQRHWVGVLHAGPGAVLTHLTAARRDGLQWVGRDVIDVLTPKGDLVEPLDGYFFHQTRRPYEAMGQAGQRSATAADRVRRAAGRRAGPQRTSGHRAAWPPACSRA